MKFGLTKFENHLHITTYFKSAAGLNEDGSKNSANKSHLKSIYILLIPFTILLVYLIKLAFERLDKL